MNGKHTIKESAAIAEKYLAAVMEELIAQNILLKGMIIRPNMILEGSDCPTGAASPQEVAFYTIRTLTQAIPPSMNVGGITFLSDGQSKERAFANLTAMNQNQHPWELNYAYDRSL